MAKFHDARALSIVAIRIWADKPRRGDVWRTVALTNFLWVFFGCPSGGGGDDRKRIFTEGWEGGRKRGRAAVGRGNNAMCV